MALVPSASSLWTGDPTLEPLLEEMHKECEGKLNPKECVALLRKAEWRLPLGIALGTVELQTREIKAITGAHADTKTELAEYNEDRLAHDAMIEEQAMINAHAYSNNQEVEVFRVNDIKVKQYVARVAAAEAAAIAAEVRAVAAETAVMDADDRQDAAVAGYVAECERLQAEVDRREELRDANVKLELELAELRLGGRSEKMAIADAYEEELAMSRLLWEMAGPSDDREVWKEANTRQLDAVGETLAQQLDDARGAYGTLVAELWEHNARAQSLARALGVVEEYSHVEQLAEEARRVKVGPADVDRIARELARMENAEQASSNAAHAASKNLAAATAVVDEVTARVAQLEAEIAALEEEHPGIFEMKDPAEAKENGGKLTPEEIGAADLMSRFHNTRAELERAVAVQEVAQQHLKLCDDEHARTTLGMQELRRERKHWRDGPTLPVRIEAARETEKELSDTYEATAANMAQMHKQIRWLCDLHLK